MADGELVGTIVDIRTSQPIGGASIFAKRDGGQSYTVPSLDTGKWRIKAPPGTYDLTVSANGYEEAWYVGIHVFEKGTTTLPLRLHPLGYFD